VANGAEVVKSGVQVFGGGHSGAFSL
jgi:hypothetical protein